MKLLLPLLPLALAGALQAADASRLGADLTPLGAEAKGNADGSIPAWTGGITTPPAGYKPGQHHPDPFAADQPLFTITKANLEQARNRFFVQGDPGAVLVVEVRHADKAELAAAVARIEADLRAAGLGYAYPVVWGDDCNRV